MHGPAMVGWLLVLVCAAAGACCLARSRSRTSTAAQRREAGGEALMGLGMAAMAVPTSALPQPTWSGIGYAAGFTALGVWALVRRHPHHVVGAAAMVYMAWTMATSAGAAGAHATHVSAHVSGGAGAGGGGGGTPVLTGLLLAYFAVYAVGAGVRLMPSVAVAGGAVGAGRPARGELVSACQVATSLATFAMLLSL